METIEEDGLAGDALEAHSAVDLLHEELEASRSAERVAVERLRQALLASEPALDPSMVSGSTTDEVEASFAAAQAVLNKLREVVAKETAGKVPAGAPGRTRFIARTPFEKIREGLARKV